MSIIKRDICSVSGPWLAYWVYNFAIIFWSHIIPYILHLHSQIMMQVKLNIQIIELSQLDFAQNINGNSELQPVVDLLF